MGYMEFKDYLNSHKPDLIHHFYVDCSWDYTNDNCYIEVEIHYYYSSTYDDWDDYSYAISKARRVIYDALHYASHHPYDDDRLHIDKIEEYNDYDPD